jgi:predicted pyridoxine 5'-phosphate oxidase superfamily flavin-nucleotide-binding protein
MAFKKRASGAAVPADPEQLYRTLVGTNDAPQALWVHQGDVLRAWHKDHPDSADVAIELPTVRAKHWSVD